MRIFDSAGGVRSIGLRMRSWWLGLTFLMVAFFSTHVGAQTYVEMHYTAVGSKTDTAVGMLKTSPNMISAVVGFNFFAALAVEGEVGRGVDAADITLNGVTQRNPVSAKIDQYYGIYLKPRFTLTDRFELFARIGYTDVKSTASVLTFSRSSNSSDWGYGLGADYSMARNYYLTAAYMSLYKKNNISADSFSLGLGYRF